MQGIEYTRKVDFIFLDFRLDNLWGRSEAILNLDLVDKWIP